MIALQLSRLSYAKFPFSTTIDSKLLHPLKALSPIFFKLFGILIEVMFVRPENAPSPILVTLNTMSLKAIALGIDNSVTIESPPTISTV